MSGFTCTDAEIRAMVMAVESQPEHLRPVTFREFAGRLCLPSGPRAGMPWDPSSDPVQSWLISQIDLRRWERVYASAPPQIGGKTLVLILLPALRTAIGEGDAVGYGLPTLEDLNKAWTEKLHPAICGAGFRANLPERGPGSRGGRGPTITFRDPESGLDLGRLVFFAAGAYGSTVSTVLIDEVDQLRKADGTPLWEALEDMFHRADSFGDQALRIATGTIEHDSLSIILVLTSDEEGSPSTGTRPWWPCPHCETHQRWELVDGEGELAQLNYTGEDEEAVRASARLTCGRCASLVTEAERQAGIRRMLFPHRGQTVDGGVVVGPSPVTRSLGILWSAADCSLTSLPELAVEHWRAAHQLEASGERGLMRKFVRYRACKAYKAEDQLARMAPSAIVRRASGSTYGRGEIPWRHAVVSLAVDQQLRELFWLVSAHLAGQTAVVAWGVEYVCRQYEQPSGQQRREALSRIVELCARWSPSVCGVDVGGGGKQTQEGRSWSADTDVWLMAGRWCWWAIRGAQDVGQADGKHLASVPGWYSVHTRPDGRRLLLADGHEIKSRIQTGLSVDPEHAAAVLLPRPDDEQPPFVWLAEHLTAEELRPARGGRLEWIKVRRRNDWLDCLTYTMAMARLVSDPGRATPAKAGIVGRMF